MRQRLLFITVVVFLVGAFMIGAPSQTSVAIEYINGYGAVEASAACDGDDLVITWTGPDYIYDVAWGEHMIYPNGILLAVPPTGINYNVTSPHRLTGPGTWIDVVLFYEFGLSTAPILESPEPNGKGRNGYVELGDFTCPEPEPEPDAPVYGCTFDGRLNDDFCGYPVAVYRVDGKLVIYALDPANGAGLLVLDMRESELPASAVNPFTGQMIWVNELSTGEVQINTAYADGKEYIFVIGSVGSYHLAR